MTKPLLSPEWINRLESFSKLIVGFSGGLDSTVLLHVLATQPILRSKIIAVHINHGISPNAYSWQKHCEKLCHDLGIKFISQLVDFDRNSNLEAKARDARYQVFTSLLKDNYCLVLGHHLNDQAETLMLQLFRGAGIDGMAAMTESSYLGSHPMFRPFLQLHRDLLEHYTVKEKLTWINDESNEDVFYARNFLRHKIIPLLESQWPEVINTISRTAEYCQQAKMNCDELALIDCPELSEPTDKLNLNQLRILSSARSMNVLRYFLKKNKIKSPSSAILKRIISEVIEAKPDASPLISWGNVQVRRYQKFIYLINKQQELIGSDWSTFPKELDISDITIYADKTKKGLKIPPQSLIQIKFRCGGETFKWHGQTKTLKKLYQEWEIPPWLRDRIPLLYINNQLAQVIGYAISDDFYSEEQDCWHIHVLSNGV